MKLDPYARAPRVPDAKTLAIDTLVPGDAPLLLEIGPGRGMFALEYAAAHLDHRVLALEVRRKYATLLADRFAARKFTHARSYAEDAREVLPRITPDGCVRWVAIHFPDPWWKKRHAKRLVVGDALVEQLARLVCAGGVVFVQTDVEGRADEYYARFAANAAFDAGSSKFVDESPFAPARSNREKRAMADGLPIYRMCFTRTSRSVDAEKREHGR
jgi:tRNA (guanine-N7-)-methyltransferase